MTPRAMCVCWDFFAEHFRRALCVLSGVPTGQAMYPWEALPVESQAAIVWQIETMASAQENSQKGRPSIGGSGKDARAGSPTGIAARPVESSARAAGNGAGRLQFECEHCKEEGRSFCTCSPLRVTTAKASAVHRGATPGAHHKDTQ